jgi:hypothetical protein
MGTVAGPPGKGSREQGAGSREKGEGRKRGIGDVTPE